MLRRKLSIEAWNRFPRSIRMQQLVRSAHQMVVRKLFSVVRAFRTGTLKSTRLRVVALMISAVCAVALSSRWRQKRFRHRHLEVKEMSLVELDVGRENNHVARAETTIDLLDVLQVDQVLILEHLRPQSVVRLGMTQRSLLELLRHQGRWLCPSIELRLTNCAALLKNVQFQSLRSLRIWTRRGYEQCKVALTNPLLCRQLQEIALRGCLLHKDDFVALRPAWPKLHTFNCEKNGCTDEVLFALVQNLPVTCRTLNLRYNHISLEGSAASSSPASTVGMPSKTLLEQSLDAMQSLTTLNLKMNAVSDTGVAALAQLLHNSLRVLNLRSQNPKLTHEAAMALSKNLEGSQLQCLRMRGNVVGDKGALAFSTVLPRCKLKELDLEANEITHIGKSALHRIARSLDSHIRIIT